MNATLALNVTGIGAWLPGAPDWTILRGVLRGEHGLAADSPAKPTAELLPAAERRRAPDGVRLATEVAAQACAMAGSDASRVPCVFASTQGELAITDYVCEILARAPLELSPTKFHNSVLNAPAGYWTIATGCMASSSAVSAYHLTFAAGLLEAAVLACADDTPVLFASGDVASSGPLLTMTRTTLACGAALLLSPHAGAGPRINCTLHEGDAVTLPAVPLPLQAVAHDNPANAQALAMLLALAADAPTTLALPVSKGLLLEMEITP